MLILEAETTSRRLIPLRRFGSSSIFDVDTELEFVLAAMFELIRSWSWNSYSRSRSSLRVSFRFVFGLKFVFYFTGMFCTYVTELTSPNIFKF